MSAQQLVRVFLVSLPGLVQQATRATLMSFPDIFLTGTASGALSATRALPQLLPDLLLVDANLPDEEVQALLRWTQENCPSVQCVVMTMTSRQRDQALAWGASAAIQRSNLAGQLETVMRQVPHAGWQDNPIYGGPL